MTETKLKFVKFSLTFCRYFSSVGCNLPRKGTCYLADSSAY